MLYSEKLKELWLLAFLNFSSYQPFLEHILQVPRAKGDTKQVQPAAFTHSIRLKPLLSQRRAQNLLPNQHLRLTLVSAPRATGIQ